MKKIVFDNDRVGLWMQEREAGHYRDGSKCIGLEKDGKLVAGAMYDWHNGASVYAHISIESKYIDRNFLWIIFDYPFRQLNCNVIIGLVSEDNLKAQRFDEHLGFKLEHRIKHADPSGDLLIYTMRKEDCKWIKHENIQPTCLAVGR